MQPPDPLPKRLRNRLGGWAKLGYLENQGFLPDFLYLCLMLNVKFGFCRRELWPKCLALACPAFWPHSSPPPLSNIFLRLCVSYHVYFTQLVFLLANDCFWSTMYVLFCETPYQLHFKSIVILVKLLTRGHWTQIGFLVEAATIYRFTILCYKCMSLVQPNTCRCTWTTIPVWCWNWTS